MNLQEQLASEYILYGYQLSTAESTDVLGTTYKAISRPGQAPIAVQVLTPEVCENQALIEALEDYAFQQSKLSHPNVQHIFELTNGSSGGVLVKEFIQGIRLDAYLKQKKAVDWQLTLRFLKQLLHGLAHAHEAGFIHGSLSPENIYVSRGNSLKLTNIGLNHVIKEHGLLSEEDWDKSNTRKYVAPEVLSGEYSASHESSDIYSIGLIAYEMLTGMRPGGHTDSNYFVEEHLTATPKDPAHFLNRAIPEELSTIVQRATEHHAIHRYPNVEAMLEALNEIDASSAQPNVIYHRRAKKKRSVSVNPIRTLLFIGALLATASAGFYLLQYLDKENPFVALQNETSFSKTLNEASAASPDNEDLSSTALV
ncbi:MAG: serine/threonine protein kinase, partial [Rhodothermales bacterium]